MKISRKWLIFADVYLSALDWAVNVYLEIVSACMSLVVTPSPGKSLDTAIKKQLRVRHSIVIANASFYLVPASCTSFIDSST